MRRGRHLDQEGDVHLEGIADVVGGLLAVKDDAVDPPVLQEEVHQHLGGGRGEGV